MGKKWDYDVPSVDVWREVIRVLKPGGHLLAFGGTRTYHRLVVAIEDAGFEIRDQVQWIYGQGFPKSLDISKAIDKAAGAERTDFTIDEDFLRRNPGTKLDGIDRKKEYSGTEFKEGIDAAKRFSAATDAAKQWQGWGTALKPANEPICLARKPLEKGLTVAANVQKWGTGGLNIDGSRIGAEQLEYRTTSYRDAATGEFSGQTQINYTTGTKAVQGRFPANALFDETSAGFLDLQTGTLNPSRFFYVAKASTSERNAGLEGMPEGEAPASARSNAAPGRELPLGKPRANFHPTVKPIKLMEYLCKLITPPGGVVLDPFMGSGTTGVAARRLGFAFTGIELNPEYFEIARARIDCSYREREELPAQTDLEELIEDAHAEPTL